jgi:hypothetical protein
MRTNGSIKRSGGGFKEEKEEISSFTSSEEEEDNEYINHIEECFHSLSSNEPRKKKLPDFICSTEDDDGPDYYAVDGATVEINRIHRSSEGVLDTFRSIWDAIKAMFTRSRKRSPTNPLVYEEDGYVTYTRETSTDKLISTFWENKSGKGD